MATRPHITWPFVISTLALLLVVVVVGMSLQRVIAAALLPGYQENQASAKLAEFEEYHKEDMATYEARFKGRSLFKKPAKTRTPTVHTPKEKDTSPPPPPPPPPLPRAGPYSGPSPAFVFGDTVWFQGGKLDEPAFFVSKGETKSYNGGSDLTVIDIEFPTGIKVKYGNWEYDLDLITDWDTTPQQSPLASRRVHGVTATTVSPAVGSDGSEVPGVLTDASRPQVTTSPEAQSAAIVEGVSNLAGFESGAPGRVSVGREKPLRSGDPEQFPDAPQDDSAATGGPPE